MPSAPVWLPVSFNVSAFVPNMLRVEFGRLYKFGEGDQDLGGSNVPSTGEASMSHMCGAPLTGRG